MKNKAGMMVKLLAVAAVLAAITAFVWGIARSISGYMECF